MKSNVIEIKQYDVIKYLKCIYLVKDFYLNENGKYILDYHFRTLNKSDAKIHSHNTYELYDFHAVKLKKASNDEIKHFISRIKKEKPDFNLTSIKYVTFSENILNLNEEECVKFLKSKGYLVYKQV